MTGRLLITGSRDWDDMLAVVRALRAVAEQLPRDTVLVSGACPTGADLMCEQVWSGMNRPIERHPAQWAAHGKRAGFVRNAHMVKLGADQCVAFIRNGSRGATMTAELAENAGIPVTRVLG
jgi:hypothetical protein